MTEARAGTGCWMRCGCGCGCRPAPSHQLLPGPARRALVGSLGTPLALSHTCTVARQRNGVATPRRQELGGFYFLAAPTLSLEIVEGFGFPPQGDPTPTLPVPSQQPSLQPSGFWPDRPQHPRFAPAGQAPSEAGPHLSVLEKASSAELGTSPETRWHIQGGSRKGGRKARSGLDSGFTHRLLSGCFPNFLSASHLPASHYVFTFFRFCIDPL